MTEKGKPILMAIPNVSEGRDENKLLALEDEIRNIKDVKLINRSSDADHNRSVYTFLGTPYAVLQASKAFASKAFELIDMRYHTGSHPRIGAVDVFPFVPIRNMEMSEAIELSRSLGKFIGEQGVSVYYYEQSATKAERENLPNIRKGEYEGLAEKLKDHEWQPDEGPCEFNAKSGATVCGARFPLIAFNINLHTKELAIAQKIAKAIRYINGGYRYVRAMGVPLEAQGMVQVSINMINYKKTPLSRVLETVRFEAARYGVNIAGSEIVGSLPLDALEELVQFYLQTHDFSINQVIESALLD